MQFVPVGYRIYMKNTGFIFHAKEKMFLSFKDVMHYPHHKLQKISIFADRNQILVKR